MGKIVTAYILSCLFVYLGAAQSQRTIPADRDALTKGEPAGTTLVAEVNLYPSPEKALSFKDQLGLTKDQIQKINELVSNTTVSATVKASDIIEAEEQLNQLFATGAMNDRTLRAKLERIGKLRADYSFLQLQAYLKMKQILSVNQCDRYKELVASEAK